LTVEPTENELGTDTADAGCVLADEAKEDDSLFTGIHLKQGKVSVFMHTAAGVCAPQKLTPVVAHASKVHCVKSFDEMGVMLRLENAEEDEAINLHVVGLHDSDKAGSHVSPNRDWITLSPQKPPSSKQELSQPSSFCRLPSSHSSGPSFWPLPQIGRTDELLSTHLIHGS